MQLNTSAKVQEFVKKYIKELEQIRSEGGNCRDHIVRVQLGKGSFYGLAKRKLQHHCELVRGTDKNMRDVVYAIPFE